MRVTYFLVCVTFAVFFFVGAVAYEFVVSLVGSDLVLEKPIAGRVIFALIGLLYSWAAADVYKDIKKKKS
ncbi:hypothetical protein [Risungbinella massiliensis]|uniref:hypothetical protein n=1 Tax=Risungbinella massiliensis TaxID=1329796 RepID=UPI0005CC244B|nr:hypothetical protein [Risungbinella massiliensis]